MQFKFQFPALDGCVCASFFGELGKLALVRFYLAQQCQLVNWL